MVSHDLHVVMGASNRVICLNGHICCEGKPEVVASAPEYRTILGSGTGDALALDFSMSVFAGALVVAIKVVSVLPIAAMLIIPAAARLPERMAALAALTGTLSVLGGLNASFALDTPTGPAIVCVAALMFAATSAAGHPGRREN